jgi:hypothetical protein
MSDPSTRSPLTAVDIGSVSDNDFEWSMSTGSESGNLFTGPYSGNQWSSSSDTDTGSDE